MCEQFAQRNIVHFELPYTPFGLRLDQAKTNNFCRIVRKLHKFSIDNIIIYGACASNSTLNTFLQRIPAKVHRILNSSFEFNTYPLKLKRKTLPRKHVLSESGTMDSRKLTWPSLFTTDDLRDIFKVQ